MLLPSAAYRVGMRYRDPACEALLQQLGKGKRFTQPVLLGFAGMPRIALAAAAREMAGRLGRPLLRVDLSASAGHYIGETEKNLLAVFSRAESSDAVLLFDEADALFGKRTAVDASHDRYANLETNHLLARLEQFRGVAVVLFDSLQEAQQRRGRLQPVVLRFPPA
ncbi:MAG: ATP-binding protein [Rubrivivax sp.]|nr:ATP-binding protein [Rubrivivax sp.]